MTTGGSGREYPDQTENGVEIASAVPDTRCDTGRACETEETDGHVSKGRHQLGRLTLANLGPIFVVDHVTHPMEGLDFPMTSDQLQESPGRGLLRRETADAVDGLVTSQAPIQILEDPLDSKHLLAMGKGLVADEVRTGPDSTLFDAAVTFIYRFVLRGKKSLDPVAQCSL